ncbi:helix-turn-helix domain-containing protein [Acetobacteraceae bacterium H6797]|nr:helix-turn-helix domain-containing protein [Acetobacteraceae bacterium H6797]
MDESDSTADAFAQSLAARLKAEREGHGWSIAELAERSGVSRAMISRVERAEASPTAALLGRLSGALGLTMSGLLARVEADAALSASRMLRVADQPLWRDPGTGYRRRALTPGGLDPELTLVELPPGAKVPFPASSYEPMRAHTIWLISGRLDFVEAGRRHRMEPGDCFARDLSHPMDCAFENPSDEETATYLVAVNHR